MKTDWRLPSIMELSLFLEFGKWKNPAQIWSRTSPYPHIININELPNYHWTGGYRRDNSPKYEIRPSSHELIGIFVKTGLEELHWSRVFRGISFKQATEIYKDLAWGTSVVYRTPRIKVFNEQ